MNINFLNFKTMKTIKFYAMAVLAISMFASCSNDDDSSSGGEIEKAQIKLTKKDMQSIRNSIKLKDCFTKKKLQFKDFLIKRMLGQGSFGCVYLAKHN